MTSAERFQSILGGKYRYYVLGILMLTYAFSYMDRQIVSILLGNLKEEFGLNDTQLGLLSGLAFALFYSVLAIPIARYADKNNRVTIISIAVFVWSVVTALCAAVGNFFQLLLCRIGVGVGEAGGLSPSHSILSDYFDKDERPLALSIFSLGTALGAVAGLMMGGYVGEHYGWRMAFLVAGLPGIALAILVYLTLKEPIRGAMESANQNDQEAEGFKTTVASLLKNKIYLGAVVGHVLAVFVGYAVNAWFPQLLLRTFDVTQTQVGIHAGIVTLVGGVGGLFAGGMLATKLSARAASWQLRVPAFGIFMCLPIYMAAVTVDSYLICCILFGLGMFFFGFQHGPGLAVVQSYVKPNQRATAAALNFFCSNLLGLGLGPLLVGSVSDMTADTYGVNSLNFALGVMFLVSIPASYAFYRTSKLLK